MKCSPFSQDAANLYPGLHGYCFGNSHKSSNFAVLQPSVWIPHHENSLGYSCSLIQKINLIILTLTPWWPPITEMIIEEGEMEIDQKNHPAQRPNPGIDPRTPCTPSPCRVDTRHPPIGQVQLSSWLAIWNYRWLHHYTPAKHAPELYDFVWPRGVRVKITQKQNCVQHYQCSR